MHSQIREIRRAKGLTLADVGARCQPPTTAQTIGRLETGMRGITVDWLNRIAMALEVEPSTLVTSHARADVAVAALLTARSVEAPRHNMVLTPPCASDDMLGLVVEESVGDYRAGDEIRLQRVTGREVTSALNRDCLVPLPAGAFAFGRLLSLSPRHRLQLMPVNAGAHPIIVQVPGWVAVVHMLIRKL